VIHAENRFEQHRRESSTLNKKQQQETQDRFEKLWNELKGSEARMQKHSKDIAERAVNAALTFDKVGTSERKLLDMIDREVVDAVRQEQAKTHEKVVKLSSDHDSGRTELRRLIRIVDEKAASCQEGLNEHKKELFEDLENRPYLSDVHELESHLRKEVNSLGTICEGLQRRTTLKLNEFVDHISKLHETIDDHEHCLRHHAEEIENRSTKYDLLLCQNQIDKCVSREDYDAQLADMKGVVSWQTNKIENLGLGLGSGHKKKPEKDMMSPSSTSSRSKFHPMLPETKSKDEDTPSRQLLTDAMESDVVQVQRYESLSVDGVVAEPMVQLGSNGGQDVQEEATMSANGEMNTTSDKIGHNEKVDEVEDTRTNASAPAKHLHASLEKAPGVDESKEEEQEEDDDDDEPLGRQISLDRVSEMSVSTRDTVRQQLEAVAMALVALAHMLLAPPRLGQSNQAKNDLKSELLDQLSDLRHWVTHQTMPPGWDPSKLTTMSLRLAHQDHSVHSSPRSSRKKTRATLKDAEAMEASFEDNQSEPSSPKRAARRHTAHATRSVSTQSFKERSLLKRSSGLSMTSEADKSASPERIKRSLYLGPIDDSAEESDVPDHDIPTSGVVGVSVSAGEQRPDHGAKNALRYQPKTTGRTLSMHQGSILPPLASSGPLSAR